MYPRKHNPLPAASFTVEHEFCCQGVPLRAVRWHPRGRPALSSRASKGMLLRATFPLQTDLEDLY
jgi:hypothetical protein